jgi:hypothetical protein
MSREIQTKRQLTLEAICFASHLSKNQCEDRLTSAKNIENDPKKEERLAKSQCLACFYLRSRAGGSACTSLKCTVCEDNIIRSGNTCIDIVCLDCAKKYKLCSHCGADIDMKQRRKFK